MKNRPTTLYLPGFMTTDTVWFSPYSKSTSVSTDASHMGDSRTVTEYQNPGVGKRKFVDPTPGEYKVEFYRNPYGTKRYRSFWYGNPDLDQIQSGALGLAGLSGRARTYLTPSYDNAIYNMALEKFYDNLRESETNLAVMIGEARESGKMLQVGKSIFEVLQTARRAKRQALMNPSKTISSIWLSYQYGWKPFLSEIYNYLTWSYHAFNDGIPIRGRVKRRENVHSRATVTNGLPGLSLLSGVNEKRCEVKCWASITDTTSYNLSRITSLNPATIAWELVPLSFVVDWFYDVGGYLQLMEASCGSGMTFKKGYVTEVYYHNIKEYASGYQYRPPSGGVSDIQEHVFESGSRVAWKRRTVLTAFPRPRAPTLSVKMGWQRIASAAALLRTILLGKVAGRRF